MKNWLKTQHSKTKIMASSPIILWQIEGGKLEADFIFLSSKFIVHGDCSHEIKRWLLLESYDKPRQHIKKQRHHLANKSPYSQSVDFPVVMYRCESWTIQKAEHQRIDAFKLWCWIRLLRFPWTVRRMH